MNVEQRIKALSHLGKQLSKLSEDEFQTLAGNAANENPWFTKQNIRQALYGIIKYLDESSLREWLSHYQLTGYGKKVGIVMAGNIPLVGFHDLLCVLASGHVAMIKLSSKDNVLMRFVIDLLIDFEPQLKSQIIYADRFKDFDAVIATGSDNSSRYFDYYFGKYPHIIRKNRTSVAILDGFETEEQHLALGRDIFSYFGLGCRNVSKLFIPKEFSFQDLLDRLQPFQDIIHHHKYCNNYDYQKSILLVNRVPIYDNGFLLLQENSNLVSPISVLYYEFYNDKKDLKGKILEARNKIQCIVGANDIATVPFGQTQLPSVTDYADGVDTLQFLSTLK